MTWGPKHVQEGRARFREIAGEVTRAGLDEGPDAPVVMLLGGVSITEYHFRATLRAARLDEARIEREVAFVRAKAEEPAPLADGALGTWGPAHERWATWAVGRLIAKIAGRGNAGDTVLAARLIQSETHLRVSVKDPRYFRFYLRNAGLDTKQTRATVKLVRDIAEGRKVVETGWRANKAFNELGEFKTNREDAQDEADEETLDDEGHGTIVSVTRIGRRVK